MFRLALALLSPSQHARKQAMGIVLCAVFLLSLFWTASVPAQAQSGGWSEVRRLSSEAGVASEATLATDRYGFVHSFWTETLFPDQRRIIQYARFDGATWSAPIPIYVAGRAIGEVSAVVDQQGTMHIAWTEGLNGPAYTTQAPALDALSARNWPRPLLIDAPAGIIRMQVDSTGLFHVLYINRVEDPGVYYLRSADQGETWSEPVWLDPDIPPNYVPDSLNFEIDENGGLHAVWFYGSNDRGAQPDWVRYAHSPDGGSTWEPLFTIDRANEAADYNLTNASPRMIVQGQSVHVIWAAGDLPYRHYRFSRDAGQSWSPPTAIFGELHGQAFDGLTVDGAGRVHFVGQIRYPMGIYHAYRDQAQWTSPSLVYLIAPEDAEIDGRVHAHHTNPIIRAGNQLVITFGDGPADPNRRLFAMHRTLDDIAPLQAVPIPTTTPVLQASPSPMPPTPMPRATADPQLFEPESQPAGAIPRADLGLQVGLIPPLILFCGTVLFRWWRQRTG